MAEAKLCPQGLSQGPGDQQWGSCALMADRKDVVGGDRMLGGLAGSLGLAQENSVTVQEEEGQAASAGSSPKLSVQRSRQKAHRAQGEHRMQPPTNMLC